MSAVERERRGHIEILTINRPDAVALDELERDDEIWVVVITGSGDKAFSAGMDLKAFASGEGAAIIGASGGFAGITERHFPKPLIAAVNGSALAGGCEIMLACDLVVSADHAVFGLPEVKRGLFAGAGALLRLPKRLPMAIALEMALTGEPITAERALGLGLVNRVVPSGQLIDEAITLAEAIAANAPLAVRWSKKLLIEAADTTEEEGWKLNSEAIGVVFGSADAMEGPMAFAEKRAPNWQGK